MTLFEWMVTIWMVLVLIVLANIGRYLFWQLAQIRHVLEKHVETLKTIPYQIAEWVD